MKGKQVKVLVLGCLIALIGVLLTSCSGLNSTPTPQNNVPPKTSVEGAEFIFNIADDGAVSTTTSQANGYTGSPPTPGSTERQLLSGIEIVANDLKITHNNQQVNLTATIANNMQGQVIHGLVLVVEAINTAGAVAKKEVKYSNYTIDTVEEKSFLAFEEGFAAELQLDLVGKLATVKVSAFADTANHYIVDTEYTAPTRGQLATQQLQPQQWNSPKYARTAAELANYVSNASYNDVVSFRKNISSLEIIQTMEVDTRLLVYGGVDRLTGEARLVELVASDSFNGSIFQVTQKGDLNLINIIILNAKTSAIVNDGKLLVNAVEFISNQGNNNTQGGAIHNNNKLEIKGDPYNKNNVSFHENQAGSGGAIYNGPDGEITIDGGTSFTNNTSDSFRSGIGGAITNDGEINTGSYQSRQIKFTGNASGAGGAVLNASGATAEFVNTKFQSNEATINGGAISNRGQLEVRDSIFTSNSGDFLVEGGAINNIGTMDISGSQFTRNTAGRGAAIYTCGPRVVMRGSIMMYNSFPDDVTTRAGLAIYVSGNCPTSVPVEELSTQQNSTQLELQSVTIWSNNGVEGQSGSGIYLHGSASVRVQNSIIAMNKGGKAFMSDVDGNEPDLASFTSSNSFYSVVDNNRFPLGSGDVGSENPLLPLDPLITVNADGWPVPSGSSLAINAGDCDNTLTTDVRGEARESGSSCDMGAVELTSAELEATSGLEVFGVGPKDIHDSQFVANVTPGKPRLEVYGSVDTVNLKALRYSLNYAEFESINLSSINSDGSFTIFKLWTAGAERVALRAVANGLNTIKIEAEYNNGSVKTIQKDFIAIPGCDSGDVRGPVCLLYSQGPTPVITIEEKPDFLYYERSTLDLNSFTIKVSIRFSCPNDLEEFSYRINNNPAISIPREQLNDALDAEGKYHVFTIDVSNLPKGENGIVIGVRAFDVKVTTTVLHLNIQ